MPFHTTASNVDPVPLYVGGETRSPAIQNHGKQSVMGSQRISLSLVGDAKGATEKKRSLS